jgi:hypothetical protein
VAAEQLNLCNVKGTRCEIMGLVIICISLKRPNKLWRKYNGKELHELYTLHSFVCSITTSICNHVVIITILFCFPDPVQIALPSGIGYFRLINMQAMNIIEHTFSYFLLFFEKFVFYLQYPVDIIIKMLPRILLSKMKERG